MAAEAADAFWRRSVAISHSSISIDNWSEKDEDERNWWDGPAKAEKAENGRGARTHGQSINQWYTPTCTDVVEPDDEDSAFL